jgi:hypothetical protein
VGDARTAGQTGQPSDGLVPPVRRKDPYRIGHEEPDDLQHLADPREVADDSATVEGAQRPQPEPHVLERGGRSDAVETLDLDQAPQPALFTLDLGEQRDDDRVVVLHRELSVAPHAFDACRQPLDPLDHPSSRAARRRPVIRPKSPGVRSRKTCLFGALGSGALVGAFPDSGFVSHDAAVPELDRFVHAAQGRMTGGMSPVSAGLAALDWAVHLTDSPAYRTRLGSRRGAERCTIAVTGSQRRPRRVRQPPSRPAA